MSNPTCRTCGSQIGLSVWFTSLCSLLPTIWIGSQTWRIRLKISATSFLLGLVAYFGMEMIGALVVSLGFFSIGLVLGFIANLASPLISLFWSVKSSRAQVL